MTYLCDDSKRFFFLRIMRFLRSQGILKLIFDLARRQEIWKIAYISRSFFFHHQSSVCIHALFSTERRRILRKQKSAELVFFSIGVIRGAASVSLLVKCVAKCSEASCTLAELRGNDHRGKRPSLFFPSNSVMTAIFVICNNNGCYFDVLRRIFVKIRCICIKIKGIILSKFQNLANKKTDILRDIYFE